MEKINIMFVYSIRGFYGIGRNLSLLINNLSAAKFNISVISLTNAGSDDSDLDIARPESVSFYRIYEKHKLDLEAVLKIKELIGKHSISVLSCHGYKADFYAFLLTRFYGCDLKVVSMAHGWVTSGFKNELYYMLDKFVMRYSDKVILVAEGLRKELYPFMVPPRKITVVNNAVDPDGFKDNGMRENLRREFNIGAGEAAAGFIGRLSREKDIATSLFGIKEALNFKRDIKFLIVGDGPERGRLEKISKKLKIDNRVIFAGHRRDAKNIYKALDLYISASLKEGLPNSVLEAQAAGIPCIVTNITGNNDIIEDGINGFLVRPRDHKDMARKIAAVLSDKDLAAKFIAEGRRIIREKFSLKNRIEKLEEVYSAVAEGHTLKS